MDVSGPMLEQAARFMSTGTVQQQQEAANFLAAWKASSDALVTSSRFISPELSPHVQFLSAIVALANIDESWFKYERDVLNTIRSRFWEFTFSPACDSNALLSDRMEAVVAAVAFNDWPDNWPEFLPMLCEAAGIDRAKKIRALKILAKYLTELGTSQKITLRRRIGVMRELLEHLDTVLERVQIVGCMDDRECVLAYLEFATSLTVILSLDHGFADRFSKFLFSQFMLNDEYAELALKAIENLVVQNKLFGEMMPSLDGYIQACRGAGRRVVPQFHRFLCGVLERMTEFLGSLATSQDGSAAVVARLLEATLEFHERRDFVQEFWVLWNKMLVPAFDGLFRPMLRCVISTFYELLPAATSLSRFNSPLVAQAFFTVFQIDQELTMQFLLSQPVSHSLCFAIGILKHEALYPRLSDVMGFCKSDCGLDVVSAVLFALTRNMKNLQGNSEVIRYFEQMVSAFLFRNPEFQTSILLGLNHVASFAPDIFFDGDLGFVDFLFSSIDPGRMEMENFSRLCRILAKVIMRAPMETKDALGTRLTGMASSYLQSDNPAEITLGAEIVWSFGSLSFCGSYLVTSCLWEPLLATMNKTKDLPVFDDVIAVFPSTIRSAPWGTCRKLCKKFITLISDITGHDAAIVEAFNQLAQCHLEVRDYRGLIVQNFVQRLASDPNTSFFDFFEITELLPSEEDVVMNIACETLRGVDITLAKAAAKMLKTVISKRKDPEFLVKWQSTIITTVFASLLSDVHIARSAGNVLFAIYKKRLRTSSLTPDIDAFVVRAISETVDDSEFCGRFAQTLRDAANDRQKFTDIIQDFLITTGRVNPSEIRLFISGMEISALSRQLLETAIDASDMAIRNEDEFVTSLS